MYIEFLKPRPGMAYFEGDKADVPDELANQLIKEGYAVSTTAISPTSDLPALITGRNALIKAGLYTKKQVLEAKESLSDIPGIGKGMAEEIIKQLEEE